MTNPQEQYDQWAAKQEAMGRRTVPEDERAPIPEVYVESGDCPICHHSHTYDGPLRPNKPANTPCWKCGCEDFSTESS